MRRTLNVRFLLWLVAGTLVCTGGVALAHHLQYKRLPLALLKQSQRAEDAGEIARADSYLTQYLNFAPDDIKQRARLARLRLTLHRDGSIKLQERLFFFLDDTVSRDESLHDLRRELVKVAVKLHAWGPAEGHLVKLREALPQDGEVAGLWGRYYEARHQAEQAGKSHRDRAIAAYRQAAELAPGNPDHYIRLARLLREEAAGDLSDRRRAELTAEADKVVDRLVALNKESWQAYTGRWGYRRDFQLVSPRQDGRSRLVDLACWLMAVEAGADVARALELAAGEPEVRLAAAEAAQMAGELGKARVHLDKAMQLPDQDDRLYRAHAGLELQFEERAKSADARRQARQRALTWLERGTRELKGQARFDVQWAFASLLLDTGGPEELDRAEKVIEKIRATHATPAGVDFLQGRVLFGRQQWAEAAKLFERAWPVLRASKEMDDQINLLLGRCYGELNQPGQQLDAYKRLAARNPRSVLARQGMAQAHRAQGQVDEALQVYKDLVHAGTANGAWAEMVRMMIVKAQKAPKEARGPLWDEVGRTLAAAERDVEGDPVERSILKAELLLARDRPDEARQTLRLAIAGHPLRIELRTALATLEHRLRNPREARKVLDEAETAFKKPFDVVELRLTRAGFLSGQKGDQTQAELRKLEEGSEALPARDRNRLLNGLAEAHFRSGLFAEAGRIWNRLAEEDNFKNDLRLRLVLFDLALQKGDDDDMQKQLARIRALEGGDGTFGRHAQALRLIWRARTGKDEGDRRTEALEEAGRLLDRVVAARPSWSAAAVARAEIETLRGNPDRAVQCYRDAIRLGDPNPLILRKLVETLRKQRKFQEADTVLRTVNKETLIKADLEMVAIQQSLLSPNPERTIAMVLNATRSDSRDYRDHLWLGEILAATGQEAKKAEHHLRKAIELEETEPEPWVALVRFLVSKERNLEAEGEIEKARLKVKRKLLSLTMAQCHHIIGQEKEARKYYEEAIKGNDARALRDYASFHMQREELKEAEALLKRILGNDVQRDEAMEEWARTRLALLLSARPGIDRFKEAISFLGLALDRDGNVVRDRSIKVPDNLDVDRIAARVLATQSQWRIRAEAVRRFEELQKQQGLAADDRFVLAHLYEAQNDWPRAREQMVLIASAPDATPQHLVSFVQTLLARREVAEAKRHLETLRRANEKKPTKSLELALVELSARVLEAEGQGDKALQHLRDRVDQPGAQPQEVLLLVSCLGRQKRFDEALQLLDRVWRSCSAEQAGGTSVALLRATSTNDRQRELVAGKLKEAIAKEPKNPVLQVQLGDVYDLSNRYEESEAQYHKALAIDPTNMMALNNLAWLLAQRSRKGDVALALINKAIAVAGPRGELLDTRAMVYLSMQQSDKAIADLEDALKESRTATRCFHLARAQHQASNRKEALVAFKQARDLGLQVAQLHPVEQVEHRKLEEDLSRQ